MSEPHSSRPSEAPPSAGRLLRRSLLGVFLGIIVYALMILWADVDALTSALKAFPYRLLLLAMGLSFGNYVLRFVRWEMYRKRLGVQLQTGTSFLVHLAGLSLTVTPGKMGEALKSFLIRRVDGSPLSLTAPIVVAERFMDLLAFLLLVAVGGLSTAPEHAWIFWLTLALCAVLLVVLTSPAAARLSLGILGSLPLIGWLSPKVAVSLESTRRLLGWKGLLLPTALATLGWGLECIAFWKIAGALAPEPLGLDFATYAFAISAVAGAVMILAPGGLGITEGFLTGFTDQKFQQLGLAASPAAGAAVAATVLFRFCTLWFAMGVGLVALWLFSRRYPGVTGSASAQAPS